MQQDVFSQKRFLYHAASDGNLLRRLPIMLKLRDLGAEVMAFCESRDCLESLKALGIRGIPFANFTRGKAGPLADLRTSWALYKVLRTLRVDVYHAFTIKPNIYGTLMAALAGIPLRICSVTGMGSVYTDDPHANLYKKKAVRFVASSLYKVGFLFAKSVIVQNDEDALYLVTQSLVADRKIELIKGSGVDVQSLLPPSQEQRGRARQRLSLQKDDFVIAFVGRLLREKGISELVEAVECLAADQKILRLLLIGSPDPGNPSALSEQELDRMRHLQQIKLLGHLSDVRETLWAADVFCLPSYREGLPGATLEAMALALPVITTNVAGCRDTVVNGLNGRIVPSHDPRSLAVAIREFSQMDRDALAQMSLESRRMAVDIFSHDVVVKELVELYQRLVFKNFKV